MKKQELTAEQKKWLKYIGIALVAYFIGTWGKTTETVEVQAECPAQENVVSRQTFDDLVLVDSQIIYTAGGLLQTCAQAIDAIEKSDWQTLDELTETVESEGVRMDELGEQRKEIIESVE